MLSHPDHEDWHPDVWILNAILALWMSVSGRFHIVQTVAANFPYLYFGKKSRSWSNTECHPDVVLKRPEGCKLEQFKASQYRGRSEWKVLVIRTDDALDSWVSGQYITSLGRLQGIQFF